MREFNIDNTLKFMRCSNAVKAVLRGKFIVINAYSKK